jgi:hypothetical protein
MNIWDPHHFGIASSHADPAHASEHETYLVDKFVGIFVILLFILHPAKKIDV